MKKTVFLFMAVVTLGLSAQEKQFYLGLYGSPDLSELVVTKGDIKKELNEWSRCRLAYTLGLSAGIRIKSNIWFETGVQYSLQGEQSKKSDLFMEDSVILGKFRSRGSIGYVGIPLKLRISGKMEKYYFTASVGIVPNYLVSFKSKMIVYTDEREVITMEITPDRKFTLTPFITAGLGYQMSEKTRIIIEPAFQYSLISIADNYNYHYWNFGIRTGLIFML